MNNCALPIGIVLIVMNLSWAAPAHAQKFGFQPGGSQPSLGVGHNAPSGQRAAAGQQPMSRLPAAKMPSQPQPQTVRPQTVTNSGAMNRISGQPLPLGSGQTRPALVPGAGIRTPQLPPTARSSNLGSSITPQGPARVIDPPRPSQPIVRSGTANGLPNRPLAGAVGSNSPPKPPVSGGAVAPRVVPPAIRSEGGATLNDSSRRLADDRTRTVPRVDSGRSPGLRIAPQRPALNRRDLGP